MQHHLHHRELVQVGVEQRFNDHRAPTAEENIGTGHYPWSATACGRQNETPPARGGPMGFVRRPPGEEGRPLSRTMHCPALLSPSRRYTGLVCAHLDASSTCRRASVQHSDRCAWPAPRRAWPYTWPIPHGEAHAPNLDETDGRRPVRHCPGLRQATRRRARPSSPSTWVTAPPAGAPPPCWRAPMPAPSPCSVTWRSSAPATTAPYRWRICCPASSPATTCSLSRRQSPPEIPAVLLLNKRGSTAGSRTPRGLGRRCRGTVAPARSTSWTSRAAGVGPEQWPYELATIRRADSVATRFPAILPDPATPTDSAVRRGFAVFQRTCFACHTLNGAGDARLGPDLNIPHNPTVRRCLADTAIRNRCAAGRRRRCPASTDRRCPTAISMTCWPICGTWPGARQRLEHARR
ncbi:hypothetical protein LSPH26S_03820 [Lysinibacillus sphaericus]